MSLGLELAAIPVLEKCKELGYLTRKAVGRDAWYLSNNTGEIFVLVPDVELGWAVNAVTGNELRAKQIAKALLTPATGARDEQR